MSSVISTTALEVRFDDVPVLSGVDLNIPAGSALAVIGPNGSGKSTLLQVLAGAIQPSKGTAVVDGPTPAFVLQSTEVDRSLPITVLDTVAMARYPSLGLLGRFSKEDRDIVNASLERLDVADLASRQLHELSGGQRQRVLVAQGLAQDSNVLLLDEPITGLDLPSQTVILDVIDEQVAAGRVVVVTTHELDDARRCDQVLLLNTRAIAVGTPAEVLTEDHLREAFGRGFIRVGDKLILDDPHHSH